MGVRSGNFILNILEGVWTYQLRGAFKNLSQEVSGLQAPPFFPIISGGGLFQKCSWPLGYAFQLFWVKKCVSMKKIQVEVLPYRFRDVFVSKSVKIFHRSSPLFVPSSFVLRSSAGKCSNPRLSIHFLFCLLSFSSRSLSNFFSSAFNELFTIYLSRYLA